MRQFIFFSAFRPAAWLLALIMFVGCNPPPRPGLGEISAASAPKVDEDGSPLPVDEVGDRIPLGTLKLPWETWHSYFIGGKKVGYLHAQSEIKDEDGEVNVRTTVVENLTLRRGSTTLVQSLKQSSIEARDGSLVSFDAEMRVGPTRTNFEGRVVVDALAATMIRGNTRQSENVPWSNRYRGIAAIQQTMLAKPLRLNELRRVQYLVPVTYRVGMVELKCLHRASISTMDGTVFNALEIDVRTSIGEAATIESTIWADEQGNLLKSYTPALELTAIRSTKAEATAEVRTPVDVLSVMSIAATGNLKTPNQTYRAGYLLKVKAPSGKDKLDFSIDPQVGQSFRKLDDGKIQLLVSADPDEPIREGFTGLKLLPELADSENNSIIDSGAPDVRKLAGLSKAVDQRELALDLTRTVKQLIGPGDFTRGFATASQTAKDSIGDCTERAVLLAAMLRAREIPARVVAGLVYAGPADKPVMAYHMWTIAWINDHWLALDPTSGGLAPADRIALANSNLADGNEYNCLAPILNAVGRIDIQIVNAQYQPLD